MPRTNRPPPPFPDVFRTRFSHALRQRGETQEHLAQRLGIGATHLSRVITGRAAASPLLHRALELELGSDWWTYCLGQSNELPVASTAERGP